MLVLSPRFTALLALSLAACTSAAVLNPHVSAVATEPYYSTTVKFKRAAPTPAGDAQASPPKVTDAALDAPRVHGHYHTDRRAVLLGKRQPNSTDDTAYVNTPLGEKEIFHDHKESRGENPVEQQIKHGNYVVLPSQPPSPPSPSSAPAHPRRSPKSEDDVLDLSYNGTGLVYHHNEQNQKRAGSKDTLLSAKATNGTGGEYHEHKESKRATEDKHAQLSAEGMGPEYHHYEQKGQKRSEEHHHPSHRHHHHHHPGQE